MNINLTGLLVLVFVFVVFYKLLEILFLNDKKKRRLSDLIDGSDSVLDLQEEFMGNEETTGVARILEGAVGQFKDLEKEKDGLKIKLMRAGWNSPNSVVFYIFFQTFGVLIGFGIFGLVYLYGSIIVPPGHSMTGVLSAGGFLGLLGIFAAPLALKNTTDKRRKILTRSFPDALDLLLVCVESGLALDASLARVCKELKYAHPEITAELNRTRLELTMLNDREKALNNLILRTDMVAFRSLVTALLQSEKYGTSLIDTLRILSDDYRQTRMMLAEEKAGRLPTKITVVTIPPMIIALLIMIVSPAVINMSQNWK